MSVFANISLKVIESVVAALNNDNALDAIISGVYVQAPQSAAAPYVIMRPALLQNLSTVGINVAEALLVIEIFSKNTSVIEAHNIAMRVHAVISPPSGTPILSISPYKLIDIRFVGQQFNVDRQGELRRSQMKFRLIIEE